MPEFFFYNGKPYEVTINSEASVVLTICTITGKRIVEEEVLQEILEREGENISFDEFVQKVEEIRQPIFDLQDSDIGALHSMNVIIINNARENNRELTAFEAALISEQRKGSYALFEKLAATKEAAELMRRDLEERSEE